jgi:heme O synthase-like polyprenyltransferase
MVAFAAPLVIVGELPWVGAAGLAYLIAADVLGIAFLALAVRLWRQGGRPWARDLYL